MKVISFDNNSWPKLEEKVALCLGYFDGVHLGHKKIISSARRLSKKIAVLTFDKSPSEVFKKDYEILTGREEKIHLFEELGVDYYLEIKIDELFLNIDKDLFINNIIYNINPEIVLCGKDYTFGKNKEGNVEFLESKIKTKIVDFETINNEKISSTKIKELIHEGHMNEIYKYLGRDYSISGTVIKGLGNGKKINFPTVNLEFKYPYVLPKEGVYYGISKIKGKSYKSIASFGVHPTIDKLDKPILEIHLLDFKKDLYGKEMEFQFIRYIRENKKFDSVYQLEKQIEKDKKSVIIYKSWIIYVIVVVALLTLIVGFILIEKFL